ncbi:MAG: tRNA (adenosine(37)-N6)-threonylcarbamoyltransferase complex ATPase subunit type 1 TsaE [Clostridiales bacterium]|jgi:tRNA threonylcarbamoyladenosine biosynthesis protein TsaE|nr:tRNA (adenosine(37)-N6)-threonylcarbamoyltransferase complex ATPase subunit type 1 TsaE [Clostridiales bacterium]
MKYFSDSPERTREIARKFAESLKGGDIVALGGDLGAGKTVFVKGVAAALGVKAEIVSPTFTIFNRYDGGTLGLNHFDLYRLKGYAEAEAAGLAEFIGTAGTVTVIEWAENVPEITADYSVMLRGVGSEREIEIV